jgi:hypothetical protein
MDNNKEDKIQEEAPQEGGRRERSEGRYEYRQRVNLGRIFLGIFLVALGGAYLARLAGWLPVDLGFHFEYLWPVLIILIGLSIIRVRGFAGMVLGIIVGLVAVLAAGLLIFGNGGRSDYQTRITPVSIPLDPLAARADITVKTGAGKFVIAGGGSTSSLVSGSLESNFLTLDAVSRTESSTQAVEISERGNWRFGPMRNEMNLSLGGSIPQNLTVNAGAADLVVDTVSVPVETIRIDTGASNLRLSLGTRATTTQVFLKAGASSVEISLPRDAGVKLTVNSGLTSRDLPEFTQKDEHVFQSGNYDAASRKIDIGLDLGVSSLKTVWR